MDEKYKLSCSAYLAEYIKKEIINKKTLEGWYHYIDNPEFNKVGVVATAEVLILIKKCKIDVNFNCKPMVNSLLNMQNKDGGWSFRSNVLKSATEPTARSVQALLLWDELLDSNQIEAIYNGIVWLLKHKNKLSLWGPINEKESYTYFSCVVLQCFLEILSTNKKYISSTIAENIMTTINNATTSIFGFFNNSDVQCGWGSTNTKEPTLFHTAYIIYTFVAINPTYINKHPIRKSLEFLKSYFLKSKQNTNTNYNYNIGEYEIYQFRTSRLVYIHSVDIYTVLALLQDPSNRFNEQVINKCQYYINCAEKTDWRYNESITCWRLFDVILLCDFFTNSSKSKVAEKMKHFKVAFTFADESRNLVEEIAEEVSEVFDKSEILYDKYHEADFARPQLDLYLQDLYHNCSDLIVVFLCENYNKKRWCNIEWRSIRDILNNFNYEKIMYIKATDKDIDEINLPGFYATEDGYIDIKKHSPKEIADMIVERCDNMVKNHN